MTTPTSTPPAAQPAPLRPCPFCGASPHRGFTKVQHDQLHGEPFQNYRLWCPHGCATALQPTESLAIAAWNRRAPDPSRAALVAALAEAIERMQRYQMDVDEEPPHEHREFMQRARQVLTVANTETQKQKGE